MKHLLLLLWLCGALCAQTVTLTNYSGQPWAGWARTTIEGDAQVPEAGKMPDGSRYVLGRRVGDVRVVDLWAKLEAGQQRDFPLMKFHPAETALDPVDIGSLGWPSFAGVAMSPAAGNWAQIDGAAITAHLHCRVGPMLHADLWLRLYGGQAWAPGELVLTASNPSVPDLVGVVPEGAKLTCGSAIVAIPGLPWDSPVLPAGETIGDGQARSWPVVLGWQHLMTQPTDATSGQIWAEQRLGAVGVDKVNWLGLAWPTRFDSRAWANQHYLGAVSRLHSWDAGPLGVVSNSGQTGSQEDQGWSKGLEALGLAKGSGVTIRYLTALGQSRRPMHHLEADGRLLDPALHPRCIFWSSRPHWHTGVSPDQLGKPRQPTVAELRNWNGPDREHWLINTLAAAARQTGSPALQWQLEAHARSFLMGETVTPGWSTSGPDASRSAGWAGLVVAHLWTTLEDRGLAELVAERWRQRVLRVYVPAWGNAPGGIWDKRNDPRMLMDLTGYTLAWMPYQQAVGAYGMFVASELVGPPEGKALAIAGARAVVYHAYDESGVEWDILGYRDGVKLPASEYVEKKGAHRTGWFQYDWFPLGVWVAAKSGDARAAEIYRGLVTRSAGFTSTAAWLPPGP